MKFRNVLALCLVTAVFSGSAIAGDFAEIRKILELNGSLDGREFGTEAPCFARVESSGSVSFYAVSFTSQNVDGVLDVASRGFPFAPASDVSEANNRKWNLNTELARLTYSAHGEKLELRTDCSCNKVSRLSWVSDNGATRICAFD